MPGLWPWAGETRCLSLRRHTGGGHSWGLRAQEEMRDVGAEARARPGSCPRVAAMGSCWARRDTRVPEATCLCSGPSLSAHCSSDSVCL